MSALIESTWDSIISMDMKQNRKIHIAKSVDVSIIRINTCFCDIELVATYFTQLRRYN